MIRIAYRITLALLGVGIPITAIVEVVGGYGTLIAVTSIALGLNLVRMTYCYDCA